ncbi:hypothetical protein [Halocynthiibacter sp.]|uniref:hypothetical protein n=1 Tax=Halocynthiibacter sp. TaxID=1979210 RepID=UPI003C55D548
MLRPESLTHTIDGTVPRNECADSNLSKSLVFENLSSVLDGLADLCAVIQSEIGETVSEISVCPDSLISHLQNIDRLQQNLEDLSTFHAVFATLTQDETLAFHEQDALEKYMVLSSLKSRLFPAKQEETEIKQSGAFDLF